MSEIQNVKETVLRYAGQERDYRGYVQGKGWAHAIAHAADALANLACVYKASDVEGEYTLGRDGMLEILRAVKALAINDELVYNAEEDERLAVVVIDIIDSEVLPEEDMRDWIADFGREIKKEALPADYYKHINQKHFMRSLYFKMQGGGEEYKALSKFLLEVMAMKRQA